MMHKSPIAVKSNSGHALCDNTFETYYLENSLGYSYGFTF